MTVFRHEMRRGARDLGVFTGVVAGMLALCVLLFPEMKGQMESMSSLFAAMGAFTKAFGMDQLNFGTISGYYGVECGNVLGIGGALFAALLGVRMLAKEEDAHTAEFLLTHPVSRARVAGEKLAAALLQVLFFNAVCAAASLLALAVTGEMPDMRFFLLLHAAHLCLQAQLVCMCFGISACLRRGGAGTGLGLAALLYFLNLMSNISDSMRFARYLTPFAYAEAASIQRAAALDGALVLAGLAYALLGVAVAFAVYTRRDIAA